MAVLIFAACFSSFLAPADPFKINTKNILKGPSRQHPFGTDQIGRNILSRVIYGARVSLSVAGAAVFFATLIGVPITDRKKRSQRVILDGDGPSPLNPSRGCRFHPRCRYRQTRCTGQEPQLRKVNTNRWAACYYPL